MSNFKDRLIQEKAELDERLEKLVAFQNSDRFKEVEADQQSLLNIQAQIMAAYSQVLLERIVRFA